MKLLRHVGNCFKRLKTNNWREGIKQLGVGALEQLKGLEQLGWGDRTTGLGGGGLEERSPQATGGLENLAGFEQLGVVSNWGGPQTAGRTGTTGGPRDEI